MPIGEYIPIEFLNKIGFDWDIFDIKKKEAEADTVQKVFMIENIAYKIYLYNGLQYVQIWLHQD